MFFPVLIGGASAATAFFVATNIGPYIHAYRWNHTTGIGAKYSDPGALVEPTADGFGVSVSRLGNYVAISHTTSPSLTVLAWTDASGWGAKVSNPATLPAGDGRAVDFAPDNSAVAVASTSSPYIQVYPWTGSAFGTKFSDPATLPTGSGTGIRFTRSTDAIAISHATTPFISAYPWTGAGFGTKFSDHLTLPGGNAFCVDFNSNASILGIGHDSLPYTSIYRWNTGGFGIKFTAPSTALTGTTRGVSFSPYSPDAYSVANVGTGGTVVASYVFDDVNGWGSKFSDPAAMPGSNCWSTRFTALGDGLVVGGNTTGADSCFFIWPWTQAAGYGTKYADPTPDLTGSGWGTMFNGTF